MPTPTLNVYNFIKISAIAARNRNFLLNLFRSSFLCFRSTQMKLIWTYHLSSMYYCYSFYTCEIMNWEAESIGPHPGQDENKTWFR